MERLLLLWDEWDDITGAGRHLVVSAASSLAGPSAVIMSGLCSLAIWIVAPQLHVNAAFLGLTAAFWGSHRSMRVAR